MTDSGTPEQRPAPAPAPMPWQQTTPMPQYSPPPQYISPYPAPPVMPSSTGEPPLPLPGYQYPGYQQPGYQQPQPSWQPQYQYPGQYQYGQYQQPFATPAAPAASKKRRNLLIAAGAAVILVAVVIVAVLLATKKTKLSHTAVEAYIKRQYGTSVSCNDGRNVIVKANTMFTCVGAAGSYSVILRDDKGTYEVRKP